MADTLLDQLALSVNAKQLYGTLVYHPHNYNLYWSPFEWISPRDGIVAQPGKWQFLGGPGWYCSEEIKRVYLALIELVGKHNLPNSPGEYIVLGEARGGK